MTLAKTADTNTKFCPCPFDGVHCPHCRRNVLFNSELRNRHMPHCHNRAKEREEAEGK